MVVTISGFWWLSDRYRHTYLIGVTALILLYADYRTFFLLASLTGLTYYLVHLRVNHRIIICLFTPTLILGYFKLQAGSDPMDTLRDFAIPLGLSYYTFRILHYVIENARETLPEHSFFDYVAYLFFLPTILIGPIHRFPTFLKNHRDHTWKAENISDGMERILIGYFKVTVIGNFLISKVTTWYNTDIPEASSALIYYLDAVSGSLNLYFLFAGYSDIAIGFALMLGYRVMENFNFPFFQKDIGAFWRCWHISLTSWSREYIFMPVLAITRNAYLATLASLLVVGVWHELSPRYVAWGLYHGLGIIIAMRWMKFSAGILSFRNRNIALSYLMDGVSILLTANFFFLGYHIVNQSSVTASLHVIGIILFSWAGYV